jgi:DNA-binding response OmpR family regulator
MTEKRKILVLDDDRYILDILDEALTYEEFEVKTALDIKSFFSLMTEYQPNLVLIDYLLHGINGGEVCHQIKSEEGTSEVPVILMSAYPRVFESLGTYGCDEFIAKPFDLYTLIDRVKSYMPHGHVE